MRRLSSRCGPTGRSGSVPPSAWLPLFLGLWIVQIAVQPQAQPYLHSHYWNDNDPRGLDGYLLSNFEQEIGYFTPFHIDAGIMLAVSALLMLPALIYYAFVRKDRWRVPADAPLMLAMLLAQLVVLSLAATYPFGGELRHQSIIAPFIFATAFLLLDRLAGALHSVLARNALFTAVACLSAANFAFGWTSYPWQSVEPYAAEYQKFQAAFPSLQTGIIYGDQCSTVLYWTAHHNARWTLQDRFLVDGHRIVEYRMDDGTGHPVRMLRNKKTFYFDLADPEQYRYFPMSCAMRNSIPCCSSMKAPNGTLPASESSMTSCTLSPPKPACNVAATSSAKATPLPK